MPSSFTASPDDHQNGRHTIRDGIQQIRLNVVEPTRLDQLRLPSPKYATGSESRGARQR